MIYSMYDSPILKFLVGESRIKVALIVGYKKTRGMCLALQKCAKSRKGLDVIYEELELKDKILHVFVKLAVPMYIVKGLLFEEYQIIF